MEYKIITELPKNKRGIDWDKVYEMNVEYYYEGVIYNLEMGIYNKKNKKVEIIYNGKNYLINIDNFKKGHIGAIVGKITDKFRVEIGEEFKNDKIDLIIIDRNYEERPHNIKQISLDLKCCEATIRNDLKYFAQKGLCNYEAILKNNKIINNN